ncbi:MAG TPA: hypothetical protein VLL75_16410 [Vicinamibacteria bacterium]|jgi:hypothetical protein|nr:hypothetical protein [Vicinamibacteria bacterium]
MTKHAPPEISSSGARVVASGTVIPFQEPGEVAFDIGPADERLAVILKFEDGPGGGPEPQIDVKRASARLVRIVVRGSASADGGGTTKPLTLGAFAGLKLWAHFRVFRSGAGPRTLHYTFFVEGGDISLAETLVRPE